MADISFNPTDTPVDTSSKDKSQPDIAFNSSDTPVDPSSGKDTSYLGALEYGVHNVSSGLSKSDEAAADYFAAHNLPGIASFFAKDKQNLADPTVTATANPNYAPAGANLNWRDPSTYGNLPRAVVESAPAVAPAILGTAVAGPVGGAAVGALTGAAEQGGNNLAARMANQPQGQVPTNADYAASFGTPAVTGAALGLLPGGSTVDQGILGTAATLGKGVVRDAAIGAGGDAAQQVANTAGTQNGIKVNGDEVGNSALVGGAMGAGLGAGRAAFDNTVSPILANRAANAQANDMYGHLDDQTVAGLNSRLDDAASITGADQSTPQGQGAVMAGTKASLNQDLDAITKDGLQTSRNGQIFQAKDFIDQLQPYDQRFVTDTVNAVKNGHVVTGDRLDELTNVLGTDPTGAGQTLGGIVNQYSAFNSIAKNGSWNEKAGTFQQPTPTAQNPSSGGMGAMLKNSGIGAAGGLMADAALSSLQHAVPGGPLVSAAVGAGLPIAARMVKSTLMGSPSSPSSVQAAPDSLGLFNRYAANNPAASPPQAPAPGMAPGAPPPVNPTTPSGNVINFAQARAALAQAQNGSPSPAPAPQASPAPSAGPDPAMLPLVRARAQQAVAQALQQPHAAPGEAAPVPQTAPAPQAAPSPQAAPQAPAQAAPAPTPAAQAPQASTPAPEAPAAAQADPLAAPPIMPGSIRARALAALAEQRARQATADQNQSSNINEQAKDASAPGDASSTSQSAQSEEKPQATDKPSASSQQMPGDTHTYKGMDFPIPTGLRAPRAAYTKSLENKQDQIMGAMDAAKQQSSDPQTAQAVDALTNAMRGARNQDTARGFVNQIIRNAAPADRSMLDGIFNDDFYKTWSKKKPSK